MMIMKKKKKTIVVVLALLLRLTDSSSGGGSHRGWYRLPVFSSMLLSTSWHGTLLTMILQKKGVGDGCSHLSLGKLHIVGQKCNDAVTEWTYLFV